MHNTLNSVAVSGMMPLMRIWGSRGRGMGSISDRFTFSLSAKRLCNRSVWQSQGQKKMKCNKKLYKRFLMIYSRCSVPFSCGFHSLSEQLSWVALVCLQMSAGRPEGSASLLHSYHPGNRHKHHILFSISSISTLHIQPIICIRGMNLQYNQTFCMHFESTILTRLNISWLVVIV